MLKFFRKIRQNLISENKFSKYLIYASGEILLVMIGILLALQVNNWNESQKSYKQGTQLVIDLLDELYHTNSQIDSTIVSAEATKVVCKNYFSYLSKESHLVTRDSLSSLLNQILRGVPYALELPSYEQAKSTGKLSLLDSKDILTAYSNLLTSAQGFKLHRTIATEIWYRGATWEMRSKVGGRDILINRRSDLPESLKLSNEAYFQFLIQPYNYAAIENSCAMNRQMNRYLKLMSRSSKDLIKLLEEK